MHVRRPWPLHRPVHHHFYTTRPTSSIESRSNITAYPMLDDSGSCCAVPLIFRVPVAPTRPLQQADDARARLSHANGRHD